MKALVTTGAILCVLAAGCGQSSTDNAASQMHDALVLVQLDGTYNQIVRDVQGQPGRLEGDLAQFDADAREAARVEGKDRVRAILAAKATAIADRCGECADAFDRTRETL